MGKSKNNSLPPAPPAPPAPAKSKGKIVKGFYKVKEDSLPIPLKHGVAAEPGSIFEAKNLLCYPESLESLLELPKGEERIEVYRDGK